MYKRLSRFSKKQLITLIFLLLALVLALGVVTAEKVFNTDRAYYEPNSTYNPKSTLYPVGTDGSGCSGASCEGSLSIVRPTPLATPILPPSSSNERCIKFRGMNRCISWPNR